MYLNENFPSDRIVAEESSMELFDDEKKKEITELVNEILESKFNESQVSIIVNNDDHEIKDLDYVIY
jgi:hypothetical protein